jgi:AhpD family alkylhydroperoxidase
VAPPIATRFRAQLEERPPLAILARDGGAGVVRRAVEGVMGHIDEFIAARREANRAVVAQDHLGIKRFFALDDAAYRDSALPGRTKELCGLVASLVLRCNDCIDYHIVQCVKAGWSETEIVDAANVALIVGGSIVIPHLRHAVQTLEELRGRTEVEL